MYVLWRLDGEGKFGLGTGFGIDTGLSLTEFFRLCLFGPLQNRRLLCR